jgi:hypothetical protein
MKPPDTLDTSPRLIVQRVGTDEPLADVYRRTNARGSAYCWAGPGGAVLEPVWPGSRAQRAARANVCRFWVEGVSTFGTGARCRCSECMTMSREQRENRRANTYAPGRMDSSALPAALPLRRYLCKSTFSFVRSVTR